MPADAAIANTAMEGRGFYNRNSSLQAAGIELALPFLIEAARAIPTDGDAPLVIADFGASQGKNSMRPMRLAIEALRARTGPNRAIEVVHTDLPSNDFASLFTTLQEDDSSYLAGQKHVYPSAIGRSYFEPILPKGRMHLGWNTWTLHWMSCNPVEVDDHLIAALSASQSARAIARRQQAQDWANFLAARAGEMADGARLVSMPIGCTPELHGWNWIFDELWLAATSMGEDRLLTRAELARFTAPVAGRCVDDLEAPFAAGPFHGLVLERAEVQQAPDPFWDEFQESGDAAQLGRRWSGMMRAVSSPVAAAAFADRPDSGALVDELYRRFEHRVTAAPQQHIGFLAIAVIRKGA
jgi:hypothetical protein